MPALFNRVSVPARPEIWTFQDAIERLVSGGELSRGGRNYDLMLDAVFDAYRDLPKYHDWSYYQRSTGISTEASYSTGTIAYSASTRRFTLTGGTWPTNAAYGAVRVDEKDWNAWSRISDTVLEMDPEFAPPSDIASGTSYQWFRDAYPFPSLTRKLGRLSSCGSNQYQLRYVDTQAAQSIARSVPLENPSLYTVRSDRRYLNSLSLVFIPPPSTAASYTFHENPGGQTLTVEKLSTGSVTVNGSPTPTTTVTFSTAVLDAAIHTGCVLRLSSNGVTEPTTVRGSGANFNPFVVQRMIVSVDSSTTCTVDSTIDADYTAVKYTISSPLDIRYDSMLSCFWNLVAWEFKQSLFADGKEIGQAEYRFNKSLAFAQAADNASLAPQRAVRNGLDSYYPYWDTVGNYVL